jgi:hypothetical protein
LYGFMVAPHYGYRIMKILAPNIVIMVRTDCTSIIAA